MPDWTFDNVQCEDPEIPHVSYGFEGQDTMGHT